jgi:hypothetical protein
MLQEEIKRISIRHFRPAREYCVEITPQITLSEIISGIGLDPSDWVCHKPESNSWFQLDEKVFPHVEEGSKLYLVDYFCV